MASEQYKLSFKKGLTGFMSSALAIIAGLIFGFIILMIANSEQAVPGFLKILQGGLAQSWQGVGKVINYAIPIIMTGLSVAFAFRTGLFNIGASGQFMIGGFLAIYAGVKFSFLPPVVHWLVAFLLAIIGGAIWGAVPGILKAYRNVNEVITSIMMNYIALYIINFLVPMTVYDRAKNQTRAVLASAKNPTLGLNQLLPKSNLDIGLLIVMGFVVVLFILVFKTTLGFELRACGLNKDASRYAGINEKKSIVLSMVIAGVLSGVGGGLMYLGHTGTFYQVKELIANQGFMGIPVALLGLSNPIGVFFAGLFIAHITVGGTNMQLFDFTVEIIDIIIASIIYFSAFSLLFKMLISKVLQRKYNKVARDAAAETTSDTDAKSEIRIASDRDIEAHKEADKKEKIVPTSDDILVKNPRVLPNAHSVKESAEISSESISKNEEE